MFSVLRLVTSVELPLMNPRRLAGVANPDLSEVDRQDVCLHRELVDSDLRRSAKTPRVEKVEETLLYKNILTGGGHPARNFAKIVQRCG